MQETSTPRAIDSGILTTEKEQNGEKVAFSGVSSVLSECFSYSSDSWHASSAELSTARSGSAGIVWDEDEDDESVWITGGTGQDFQARLSSSEILLSGSSGQGLSGHCLVKLSPKHAVLVGGINQMEQNQRGAFLYNREHGNWTKIADMIDQRAGHVCQVRKDSRKWQLCLSSGRKHRKGSNFFKTATYVIKRGRTLGPMN